VSEPLPDSLIEDIEKKARAYLGGPPMESEKRQRYVASLSPDVVLSLLSEARIVARARADRASCGACKGTGWITHEHCSCCEEDGEDECDIQERCSCGSVL
jgi:hypothetical protein